MNINGTHMLKSVQVSTEKQKNLTREEGTDFNSIIFQLIAMLNMQTEEQNFPGNELQEQINQEIPNMMSVKKTVLSFIEQFGHSEAQEINSDISREIFNLFQPSLEEEELQKIVQQIISTNDNALKNPSEKSNSTIFQKLLVELEKFGVPIEKDEYEIYNDGDKRDNFREVTLIDPKRINRFLTLSSKIEENIKQIHQIATKEIVPEETPKKFYSTGIKKLDTEESSLYHQTISNFKNQDNIQKLQQPVEVQDLKEVVDEMIEEIRVLKEGEQSSLQVKLKPKELGEIEIKLEMKAGEIVGKILVESLAVKTIIENQLQNLKGNFKNQDINIQEVDVSLQEKSQGQSQGKKHGSFSQEENKSNQFLVRNYQEEKTTQGQSYFQQPILNAYYNKGQGSSLNLLA